MDLNALIFYAIICGILSLVAPKLGGLAPRFFIGALVGAASAAALPNLLSMIG